MDKLPLIFLLAFYLNWIWENLHSRLYNYYRGNKITQKILIRASLVDAIFITAMAALFVEVSYFRLRLWYSFIFGFIAAVSLENYALRNDRWKYNKYMPILPLIKTGLTPTFQLGVLSYFIYEFQLGDF